MNLLERNTAKLDIDCPGDTIIYNCSIHSNSEMVHLVWNIILPDFMPLTVIYDNTSILNKIDSLDISFLTMVTNYNSGEYIESIIFFNVLGNITRSGTLLECSISDLDTESLTIFENISCKLSALDTTYFQFLVH